MPATYRSLRPDATDAHTRIALIDRDGHVQEWEISDATTTSEPDFYYRVTAALVMFLGRYDVYVAPGCERRIMLVEEVVNPETGDVGVGLYNPAQGIQIGRERNYSLEQVLFHELMHGQMALPGGRDIALRDFSSLIGRLKGAAAYRVPGTEQSLLREGV